MLGRAESRCGNESSRTNRTLNESLSGTFYLIHGQLITYLIQLVYHFITVRNDCDTDYNEEFVTHRRRVIWLIAEKDISIQKLSKILLAKAVAAQDETFPMDAQFGIFSVEGNNE